MGSLSRSARRVAVIGAGALIARTAVSAISRSSVSKKLDRTNHHGGTVSLAEGPAAAIGAATAAALGSRRPAPAAAALTAGIGSGAVGLYDDMVGAQPEHAAKGLKGHLSALAQGRLTSGAVKIAGVGLSAMVAAVLIDADRGSDGGKVKAVTNTVLGAGVIAGTANLLNLFDLRPGRALKVTSAVTSPLANGSDASGIVAAATLGTTTALLPEDLGEETMLGDCGANALGALVGLSMAARSGPAVRGVILAAVTGLTLASEKVSFTKVIADTPVLRQIDEFGRKPRHP